MPIITLYTGIAGVSQARQAIPMTASPPVEAGSYQPWQRAILLGAAYFACAEAGRFLSVPNSTYVSFWLPGGLYVAALLLDDTRTWPALVLGAFAGNLAFDLVHGTPVPVALCFCLTNAAQAVLSAWLIRRFVAERPDFATLKEFLGFLGFAAVLGSMAGATLGAATLAGFGLSASFVQSWKVWWGSNAMAMLLLSPFILTWFSADARMKPLVRYERFPEASLLIILQIALTWHLLSAGEGVMAPDKGYMVVPLLWAGLRFGPRGAAGANLMLAVPVAFFTTQFHAGLSAEHIASGRYVFVMQVALAIVALVALIPAIVLDERNRRMQDLRDSEAQLRLSVHASNIGLWDWNIRDDRLYLSPEWKSQLGHRDDEIANHYREWESRLHPEDRERVLPKIRAYLANPGPSYEAEFRLRHKDGSYRWIFARAQVEHDPEGNPLRMLGCHIDITDRKRTEEELQRSFSRLRELSRRVAEAQEAERRNISRELHDRVGQNLSALNLSLNLVRAQLAPGAPPAITDRLQDAQHLVEASVQQVRDVMADLRPPALDDYGLLAALRTHADALSGRLGVPVVVTGREPEPRLSTATETALFRIAQEALNNVSKHAHAANVQVRLATLNGVVEMSVTDDGVGFDTGASSSERPTWGLKTMRERAEAVGATLRIERAPSGGTRVVVEAERGEA
jgi:PAS domain S-box-containing protein